MSGRSGFGCGPRGSGQAAAHPVRGGVGVEHELLPRGSDWPGHPRDATAPAAAASGACTPGARFRELRDDNAKTADL